MLYRISKKSGLRREFNKINNIRAKTSKKGSDSSSDDSKSDTSLASDSSWDTNRRPAGRNEMGRLDHVVAYNLNNYKYQSNEAFNSELTFDTSSFNLSSSTSNP